MLLLDDLEELQAKPAQEGAAAKGAAVLGDSEGVKQIVIDQQGAEWKSAA